ncbi:hypothetical protein L596_005474 [Steinernema carpocapsae]|uniref:Uncharacterized protein n=1 Tax=Steinernema carpocapsae TaxID=34508 RepID=A0A4U8V3Y1_STECR|nr:hypothetical protein L596_005474 [Steinernema carpocapsae]
MHHVPYSFLQNVVSNMRTFPEDQGKDDPLPLLLREAISKDMMHRRQIILYLCQEPGQPWFYFFIDPQESNGARFLSLNQLWFTFNFNFLRVDSVEIHGGTPSSLLNRGALNQLTWRLEGFMDMIRCMIGRPTAEVPKLCVSGTFTNDTAAEIARAVAGIEFAGVNIQNSYPEFDPIFINCLRTNSVRWFRIYGTECVPHATISVLKTCFRGCARFSRLWLETNHEAFNFDDFEAIFAALERTQFPAELSQEDEWDPEQDVDDAEEKRRFFFGAFDDDAIAAMATFRPDIAEDETTMAVAEPDAWDLSFRWKFSDALAIEAFTSSEEEPESMRCVKIFVTL